MNRNTLRWLALILLVVFAGMSWLCLIYPKVFALVIVPLGILAFVSTVAAIGVAQSPYSKEDLSYRTFKCHQCVTFWGARSLDGTTPVQEKLKCPHCGAQQIVNESTN